MVRSDNQSLEPGETVVSQQDGDAALTAARRAFAQLLSRLLTVKWRDEATSRPARQGEPGSEEKSPAP
jgi:hypothetical protein